MCAACHPSDRRRELSEVTWPTRVPAGSKGHISAPRFDIEANRVALISGMAPQFKVDVRLDVFPPVGQSGQYKETDHVWIMLHTGSRGVGNIIGTYFIEKAREEMRTVTLHPPAQRLNSTAPNPRRTVPCERQRRQFRRAAQRFA